MFTAFGKAKRRGEARPEEQGHETTSDTLEEPHNARRKPHSGSDVFVVGWGGVCPRGSGGEASTRTLEQLVFRQRLQCPVQLLDC
jgi:hypothetical protein